MAPDRKSYSRRERQIVEILYRLGEAGAQEVLAEMPDPPSYSAVRATLRVMEEKGYLSHREEAGRYLYRPRRSAEQARRTALRDLLHTFFGGSSKEVVAALLDLRGAKIEDTELAELEELVRKAREQGR